MKTFLVRLYPHDTLDFGCDAAFIRLNEDELILWQRRHNEFLTAKSTSISLDEWSYHSGGLQGADLTDLTLSRPEGGEEFNEWEQHFDDNGWVEITMWEGALPESELELEYERTCITAEGLLMRAYLESVEVVTAIIPASALWGET